MIFSNRAGDDAPALTIDNAIRVFDAHGESGPHSCDGYLLHHILNHCVKDAIPFTLVYMPGGGYYVKRGLVDDVMPDPIRATLEAHK